jgi:tripeptide aminopeptidase
MTPTASAPYTSELAAALAPDVLERLLRYVRIDTQSDRAHTRSPSTPGQLELGRLLVEELRALGLADVAQDANGFVTATLAGNVPNAPVIGLLAHLDTSPDESGAGVEPLVHRDYDGGAIALPRGDAVLDPERMPELTAKVGHDLVTTSGDTLLGADDKAGMAEVMAAVAYLAAHPELPRATVRVGFSPDEEIGKGAHLFDIEGFGAECAYTFDGSEAGEFTDETFTAASADLTIRGVDVHPGFATGKLVNAARLAGRVLAALPQDRLTPESTSEREGFIHVYSVEATAGKATIRTIVRDFDDDRLAEHVALLRRTAEEVVATEPRARLEFESEHQYPNMRAYLDRHPAVSDAAEEAIRREGFEPTRVPIRGGTDGSILSARGLPTPNIFTGGHEYHSVREWASVQDMASAAAVAVRLAGVWAERAG